MEEFHINFNVFGAYGDFSSWQKAELSSPVKKRKREESSKEGEAKWETGREKLQLGATKVLRADHTDFQKGFLYSHELSIHLQSVAWFNLAQQNWCSELVKSKSAPL